MSSIVCSPVKKEQLLFLEKNALLSPTTSSYELLRYKLNSSTWVLYSSKKLLIQYPQDQEQEILDLCHQHKLPILQKPLLKKSPSTQTLSSSHPSYQQLFSNKDSDTIILGSDESLKGDTFAGLVVTCAKFTLAQQKELEILGCNDSKIFTQEKIFSLAKKLLETYPNNFSTISLTPKEYNQLLQSTTLTNLLNKLHKETAKTFNHSSSSPTIHVVDKYPGCKVGDLQLIKAEELVPSVGAASIIARHHALLQFIQLSKQAGFTLPKGSTHVDLALKKIKELNLPPKDFCKLHFKNVKKIFP